jgi:hypothetical protein
VVVDRLIHDLLLEMDFSVQNRAQIDTEDRVLRLKKYVMAIRLHTTVQNLTANELPPSELFTVAVTLKPLSERSVLVRCSQWDPSPPQIGVVSFSTATHRTRDLRLHAVMLNLTTAGPKEVARSYAQLDNGRAQIVLVNVISQPIILSQDQPVAILRNARFENFGPNHHFFWKLQINEWFCGPSV